MSFAALLLDLMEGPARCNDLNLGGPFPSVQVVAPKQSCLPVGQLDCADVDPLTSSLGPGWGPYHSRRAPPFPQFWSRAATRDAPLFYVMCTPAQTHSHMSTKQIVPSKDMLLVPTHTHLQQVIQILHRPTYLPITHSLV